MPFDKIELNFVFYIYNNKALYFVEEKIDY